MIANKYLFRLLLLMFTSLGLFTSCITSKKVNYLQKSSHQIPKYTENVNKEEYTLNTGDRISIRIFSTDKKMNTLFNGSADGSNIISNTNSDYVDLYTYMVKDDGYIRLPSSDKVYVLGKTTRETKKIIEDKVKPFFKDNFSVDVKLVERYFSVIGSSNTGKFPITQEKINIFQAMAMAGDIGIYGDRSKIKIIRQTNGGTQIKTFDIRSKDIIDSEFYYIQDNDVIYIQDVKEQFFSVTSFSSTLSTVFSTLSFGIFIYNIVKPSSTSAAN